MLNLAAARAGVVLSWAPLGSSSGHHHVNCQARSESTSQPQDTTRHQKTLLGLQ